MGSFPASNTHNNLEGLKGMQLFWNCNEISNFELKKGKSWVRPNPEINIYEYVS